MKKTQNWNSSIGFILASAGSAIGLGAIWKFPYIAGLYGGGAFLLEFIIFTLLIGLPLLISEFSIGQLGKTYTISIFNKLSGKPILNSIGYLGNITAFILYAFYSVIGGWIIIFIMYYFGITFNLVEPNPDFFNQMMINPNYVLIGQAIFIAVTGIIVSFGIQNGIEKASKIMMPLLFILFMIIVIRSVTLDGASTGLKYFLIPRFEDISIKGTLYALGQSFFALSLGTTGMITYASYTKEKTNISKSAASIVFMNLLISVLAGLAIFPAAFALNIEVEAGPGLLFLVLPQLFNKIAFGMFFYILFLILFLFAALTSSISLLELNLSNIIKEDESKRKRTALWISIIVFITGIPAALSFGVLNNIKFGAGSIFDNMDFLVSYILMPIGVLLTTLFTGHILSKTRLQNVVTHGFSIWYPLVKYVLPVVILIVIITQFL
ncbi:sodium-dependent transporter [Macrococcus animalis]|uniref:sodium-dependent transporter n=1 Tax=Macrococcus animalis TaxID=3395467 RepID=UPI0039BE235B